MGDVIIKSKFQNLAQSKKQIETFKYPFVLSKIEESDKYLACRVNSCFAYDTNVTKLLQKIEETVRRK